MAETTVPSNLRVKVWDDDFFSEYIRGNRFSRYMGTTENSIIQIREDLAKKKGDTLYFELVNRLTGAGKVNNQTLEGFEEDLSQRSDSITINLYRHAVVVPEYEEQATAIDLRNAARGRLKDWSMEHVRDKVHYHLGSKPVASGTYLSPFTNSQQSAATVAAYITANATNLNSWLVNNSDRVLFGATKSNASSGVFDTALGNVDTTNDKLTTAAISLMKRIAKTANPKVRPIRVNDDEEWYVLFANSFAFRDLKESAAMQQANREARVRGLDNPLFTDGDLVYDGVIIREVPELVSNIWTDEGASSADVGEVYLCGAQGLGYALAKRWQSRTQERDYQGKYGVAIQQMYEMKKLSFGTGASDTTSPKDHGIVTGFFATEPDA